MNLFNQERIQRLGNKKISSIFLEILGHEFFSDFQAIIQKLNLASLKKGQYVLIGMTTFPHPYGENPRI